MFTPRAIQFVVEQQDPAKDSCIAITSSSSQICKLQGLLITTKSVMCLLETSQKGPSVKDKVGVFNSRDNQQTPSRSTQRETLLQGIHSICVTA